MKTKRNLVWIASYPKSGNTWFRYFLSHYLSDIPIHDFSGLNNIPISSSKSLFWSNQLINPAILTVQESHQYRRLNLEQVSKDAKSKIYLKTHDMYNRNDNNYFIYPENSTFKSIYLIRNPFDIAVSFSFHLNKSIDETIDIMLDQQYCLQNSITKHTNQFVQLLSSWGKHVLSWTNSNSSELMVIKYEDLSRNPDLYFKKAINFLEIPFDKQKFEDSIIFSQFNNLKKLESVYGFSEKSVVSKVFFRKGQVNDWRNFLSNEHVEKLNVAFKDLIFKYGYNTYDL